MSLVDSQLSRSLNEILVLAVLQTGPKHGYQIALEIDELSDGYFRFTHGTLYPILHEIEKEGLVHGEWQEGGNRRRRKTYILTATGWDYLRSRSADWSDLSRRLSAFVAVTSPLRSGLASNQ